MAAEAELERMVVRLLGDGSEYQKMLEQAQASTQEAAANVERAAGRIEGFADGIKGFASSAVQALAALGAGGLLKQAFGNFAEAETISVKLDSVLQSLGGTANLTREQIDDFAQSMEKVTTAEDDAVASMVTTALQMGATGQAALQAVKNSLALADGNDEVAKSNVRLMVMLAQGQEVPARMLRQISPLLMQIKDPAERAAKAQEILNQRFKAAQAIMNTASGALKVLKRDWGNLLEMFGDVVAKGVEPVVLKLQEVVAWLRDLSPETKKTIVVVTALVAGFVALGPVLAAATPILSLLASSFSAIGSVIGLLINPLKLVMASFGVIKIVLVAVGTALSFLTGPIGLITIGIVALAATWVSSVGGLSAAWEIVKDAAISAFNTIKGWFDQFMLWIEPVVDASISLFKAVWEAAVEAFNQAKAIVISVFESISVFITETWRALVGETQLDWGTIRDTIRDAILFAEFFVRNFGQVMGVIWAKAKLDAIVFADQIVHFFTVAIPAVLNYFADNWRDLVIDSFNLATTVATNYVENLRALFSVVMPWLLDTFKMAFEGMKVVAKDLTANLVRVFQNIPALIKGTVPWGDVWLPIGEGLKLEFKRLDIDGVLKPLTQGFERVSKEFPGIPAREIGPLEAGLRQEFEALRDKLGEDFAAFRQRKLKEFEEARMQLGKPPEEEPEKAGKKVGEGFGKGVKEGVKAADAALRGSAEAFARIAAFREAGMRAPGGVRAVAGAAVAPVAGGGLLPAPVPLENRRAGEGQRDGQVVMLLSQIRDILAKQGAVLQVEGAGLGAA